MSWFVLLLLALQAVSLASGVRLSGNERASATGVTFYMYDLPQWTEKCHAHRRYKANYYPDLAFHEVLVDHPWRTRNGTEAELFVVPGLFGLSLSGECGDHHGNMQEVDNMLRNSPFFSQSLVSRHVIPNFWWRLSGSSLGVLQHRLRGAIFARHITRGKMTFPVPYGPVFSGGIAAPPPNRRNHSLFLIGQADNRKAYRTRRTAIRKLPERFEDAVLIQTCRNQGACSGYYPANAPDSAPLPKCSGGRVAKCWAERSFDLYTSLGQQSNYTLVIHGDDATTSRLYDAAQFGHMVLIISPRNSYPRVGMPFPDDLPWKDMALFLSSEAFVQDPTGTIEKAVTQMSNESRRSLWRQARPFLDWSMGHPCMGTALISHVARKFLGKSLPPAFSSCHLPQKHAKTAPAAPLAPAAIEELKEALMEERLD